MWIQEKENSFYKKRFKVPNWVLSYHLALISKSYIFKKFSLPLTYCVIFEFGLFLRPLGCLTEISNISGSFLFPFPLIIKESCNPDPKLKKKSRRNAPDARYQTTRDSSRDGWIKKFIKRKWSSGLFWVVGAAEKKNSQLP